MGKTVSTANSNSGADIQRTERDRPIYVHVTQSWTGRSSWYSIDSESADHQGEDHDDDDPIFTIQGKADQTTDRFRRLRLPGLYFNYLCRINSSLDAYRHVLLNDTLYAMGAVGYRAYNLLEKQQSKEFSEEVNAKSAVEYRSKLLLQQSILVSEVISQFSKSSKKNNELHCNPRPGFPPSHRKAYPREGQMVSRFAILMYMVPLEGFKFLGWPCPSPSLEQYDQPGWQYSAVGLDNGWIYTLGCENWRLDVNNNGKRFDLPKPERPRDMIVCFEDQFRLLGATKTKLFAYHEAVVEGDSNVLYCLDLNESEPESQLWQWQIVHKNHWRGRFSTGVVREYDNGDSYLFCCGFGNHRPFSPAALYAFDIKNGLWLKRPVEENLLPLIRGGSFWMEIGYRAPFLMEIGHQKLAVVWDLVSDDSGLKEVHWCKFTINSWQARGATGTPTFSTQLLSRGARRVRKGDVVDCSPGILLK